ncbi:hypothetical protein [Pyxidicoccus xibeiensis]|uniref:hypothetical protein n=1 Tax=Pyxidicoccus xibeiensis TaxID=2906759 RepID=UPI0020A77906|nr:hypothetical protein [Pyxidicoccus xibeiensis]MCP3140032.1 hypothetical protein [Pyxidicoccus xibeiensis]
MQSAVGTPDRLGNDEDKQKPLKSELQETQPETVPGAHQGEIHYGMAHSETVKRLQARRAARAKKETRDAAATKRPAGKRGTEKPATESTAKPATARTATAKTAKPATAKTATAKTTRASTEDRASQPARTAKPVKTAKTPTPEHDAPVSARKKTAASAEKAPKAAKKQGLLGRALDTVAKGALDTVSRTSLGKAMVTTGSKGLARATALAKEVRAGKGKSKPAAKEEKPSSTRKGPDKKKR